MITQEARPACKEANVFQHNFLLGLRSWCESPIIFFKLIELQRLRCSSCTLDQSGSVSWHGGPQLKKKLHLPMSSINCVIPI
jgi:hypothetical protein